MATGLSPKLMKSFTDTLADLDAKGRRRSLRLPLGIDLSSNDYLGLSGHPDLRAAAIEALEDGIEIGATGSRILTTLIHALRAQGKKRGVASLCIGGGEATAIAVEVL